MSKVIFLDIDGVLNYTKWYVSDRNPGNLYGQEGEIDPMCVARLLRICEQTGAQIVISSDWRFDWSNTILRLSRAGIPESIIIGKTPELAWHPEIKNRTRGGEINEYLDKNPEIVNYIIIDDRTDFTKGQKLYHFVHVNSMYGLTDEDVEKAIKILNLK